MGSRFILFSLLLASLWILSGCSTPDSSSSQLDTASSLESSQTSGETVEVSHMFTDRDMEIGYDEESCARITLSGDSASCDADSVTISGSTVTITQEGTYLLTGTLDSGTVEVRAGDQDKVQLVLDNASVTNPTGAAVYVEEADKVVITTASQSENTLANGGEYQSLDGNNIDGAIFSKADLTLNGAGLLTVTAQAGHGIVSKDDLVLTSGSYQITAAGHGLSGKDSVRVASGTYTISAGKDAIHGENDEDDSLGFVYLANGTFQLTADGDGISASSYLLAEEGEFTIEAGGGSANGVQESLPDSPLAAPQPTSGEQAPQVQTPVSQPVSSETADTEETSSEETSAKGIKAGTELLLQGGSYTLDTADDGLHSNGDVTLSGGEYTIASGDDGIHGDGAVTLSGGTVNITKSYEGIEGLSLDITGGEIHLVSSDDGLNAAGGTDSSGFGGRGTDRFSATEGASIAISGGVLYIDASGDGIDSNGSLTVSGGETYVSGPTTSGNGALDYASDATISGGIFLAAGAAGMAQNFGSDSTQEAMLVNLTGEGGTTLSLTDSTGTELVSWQPEKDYGSVVISCPELTQGSTYTLSAGSNQTQVTMDSLIYGSGGGGQGGPKGGGNGGRPEGQMEGAPEPPTGGEGEAPEAPSGNSGEAGNPPEPPTGDPGETSGDSLEPPTGGAGEAPGQPPEGSVDETNSDALQAL